jgi:type IV pilus biogenesis protein CpaD/CtpE
VQHRVQQHLPQQEIQKASLSVQAPSSCGNDKLQAATVVRQIMRELSEGVSEDRVMIVTMMVLDLMQQYGC